MTTKRRMTHPAVAEPPPQTWSNCLAVGDWIFTAGVTARDGATILAEDEYGQAKAIFGKIETLLTAADARMDDVVKLVIYVTDIARREEVWRARREFFVEPYPVSTLVEAAALALPGLKVEIEAVAVRGAGG